MTAQKFIEIVFPDAIAPGDLDILQPATYDEAGRARLGKARVVAESRCMSHNGNQLIGVISSAEFMLPPYNFAYWLEDAASGAPEGATPLPSGEGLGVRAISPMGESPEIHHD